MTLPRPRSGRAAPLSGPFTAPGQAVRSLRPPDPARPALCRRLPTGPAPTRPPLHPVA